MVQSTKGRNYVLIGTDKDYLASLYNGFTRGPVLYFVQVYSSAWFGHRVSGLFGIQAPAAKSLCRV
jgi:hypothetical protein